MFHFNTAQMAGAMDGRGVFVVVVPRYRFVGQEVFRNTALAILNLAVFKPGCTLESPEKL